MMDLFVASKNVRDMKVNATEPKTRHSLITPE